MKTLYLECATGVSGDMLLASLVGVSDAPEEAIADLVELLAGLGIDDLAIKLENRIISSISMNKIVISDPGGQPLRTIGDIAQILDEAGVDETLKKAAMNTLHLIGTAEAKVHGTTLDTVHFHEIGAVDTIVDILGAHYLTHRLGVERVLASPVNLGSGFVTFSHGTFPVPAPACAELSKNMQTFGSELGMEAATPTGLALVKSLVNGENGYGTQPLGQVLNIGYGCGDRSSNAQPTFVRAFVIDVDEKAHA